MIEGDGKSSRRGVRSGSSVRSVSLSYDEGVGILLRQHDHLISSIRVIRVVMVSRLIGVIGVIAVIGVIGASRDIRVISVISVITISRSAEVSRASAGIL